MKRILFYATVLSLMVLAAIYLPEDAPWTPEPATTPPDAPADAGPPIGETAAPPEPPAAPRNVTPPGIGFGPIRNMPPPQPEPERPPEPEERTLHRVVIEEPGAIGVGDDRIAIAGVDALATGAMCTDDAGTEWPCGHAAVTALRLLVRSRSVQCELVDATDAATGRCSVGGQDIGEWLVEQGWAESADAERYREPADAAREDRRGMYAARWRADG